jgi:3-deoxy-D-manno-octulosonate 8-phosphate phosphatase (KDO 8-P phosphatase)
MNWSGHGGLLEMKLMTERVRKIKMLLLDVDGVMTDGGIFIGSDSIELKRFHVQDGAGIALAKAAGLLVGIITGRDSEAVRRRAKELEIDEVQQGVLHKEESYEVILEKYGLRDEEVAYMGDDLLDIPVLKRVGLSICVANGAQEVKRVSRYITKKKGGEGAVREVVEMILKRMGKKQKVIASVLKRPQGRGR